MSDLGDTLIMQGLETNVVEDMVFLNDIFYDT